MPVFASFLLPPAEGFCALISIEMGFKNTLTYETMRMETQCRAEENIQVLKLKKKKKTLHDVGE